VHIAQPFLFTLNIRYFDVSVVLLRHMQTKTAIKSTLASKFEKVKNTPAGFDFFVLVHDFIEYIEANASFNVFLKGEKAARRKEIPIKYFILRQIYQGIEDIDVATTDDLGHDRFVAIRELGLIRENDTSENNSMWRKRDVVRKLSGEVYKTLDDYLA
jgi:hypothetical protein